MLPSAYTCIDTHLNPCQPTCMPWNSNYSFFLYYSWFKSNYSFFRWYSLIFLFHWLFESIQLVSQPTHVWHPAVSHLSQRALDSNFSCCGDEDRVLFLYLQRFMLFSPGTLVPWALSADPQLPRPWHIYRVIRVLLSPYLEFSEKFWQRFMSTSIFPQRYWTYRNLLDWF